MSEKTLVMIRHAKSSWNEPGLADFDRGLNKRGKEDAPLIAETLIKEKIYPQQVILSSSKRTRSTWKRMNKLFELDKSAVHAYDQLYHSTPGEILKTINLQSDAVDTMFCIVHNPGITGFVNLMCGTDIFNIPTTGVAVIKVPSFSKLEMGEGELLHYFYPKQFKTD
ncbi:MAG: phosphohistidine phosphatase [Halobacteriovoraceae bacterium]|nr:phosphohistidine phosphatase [Halobacteriovoraceae bacterium]|tara:strand:- start:30 stop:530 length:501 start_codon:yes stop_codon:yes gene_type:complete